MHRHDGGGEIGGALALAHADNICRQIRHPAERLRRADARQTDCHAAQDLVLESGAEPQRRNGQPAAFKHIAELLHAPQHGDARARQFSGQVSRQVAPRDQALHLGRLSPDQGHDLVHQPARRIAVGGVGKTADERNAGSVRERCLHWRHRHGPWHDAHLVGMRDRIELLQLRGLADGMRDDTVRSESCGKLLQRHGLRFLDELEGVLLVDLALRVEAKMVQVSDAVDDLRIKILSRRLETARRGFNAMQIDEIERAGMPARKLVERSAG
jgi:hypothetical protein